VSALAAAVRLDVRTVSPYRRQLLPLVGVAAILSAVSTDSVVVVLAGAVFGSATASYPFAVGDKYDLDTLRAVLPVPRGLLVAARYLFAAGVYLVVGALATALALLAAAAREQPVDAGALLTALAVGFGTYAVLAGLQLPVYYALGYTRGRMVAFLPVVLASTAVGLVLSSTGGRAPDVAAWLVDRTGPVAALCLGAGVVVLAASAAVSWRLDGRRAARAGG